MKKTIYIIVLIVLIFGIVYSIKIKKNHKWKVRQKFYAHELFDVNEFDKTIFSGKIYDRDLNEYDLKKLLQENYLDIKLKNRDVYCFTKQIEEEREKLKPITTNEYYDFDVDYFKNILGNPSSIYEYYHERTMDEITEETGNIYLIYDYYDYFIVVSLYDFRLWKSKEFRTLSLSNICAVEKETFINDYKNSLSDYINFGENIFN